MRKVRRALLVGVPALIGLMLLENGLVGIPSSLQSQADWVASLDDEATVRAAAVVAGSLLIVVSLALAYPTQVRELFGKDPVRQVPPTAPPFPLHRLELGTLWYADLPNPYYSHDETRRVVFLPVEYTNRGERGVSLRFELLWWRDVRGDAMGPYRVSRASSVALDRVIDDPLHVAPDKT